MNENISIGNGSKNAAQLMLVLAAAKEAPLPAAKLHEDDVEEEIPLVTSDESLEEVA